MWNPPSFENPKFPNRVYKLQKALYGLKQTPRAWYDIDWKPFCWLRALKWDVLIKLYSSCDLALISFWFRYMWMILSLVALLTLLSPSFLSRCPRSSRWAWWVRCNSFSGCRSSKFSRARLFIKPSTPGTCCGSSTWVTCLLSRLRSAHRRRLMRSEEHTSELQSQ